MGPRIDRRALSHGCCFGIYSVLALSPCANRAHQRGGAAAMKSGPDFNPAGYAPVAERITQFYDAHPQGRIVTELVSRTNAEVVFRASVYRDPSESGPAATGWAAEREGDGDVNEVACLENTETSAVGRALANLGFTASRLRPSAEEMAKAARARVRLGGAHDERAEVADLLALVK